MSNLECGSIVSKFGGSSVATAERFRNVGEIINSDPRRRFIIFSAPGKRFPNDEKITDLLLKCDQLVCDGKPFDIAFDIVTSRFRDIAGDLECHSIQNYLDEVYQGVRQGNKDWIASRGEWLNCHVAADFFGWLFSDPLNFIRLTSHGEVDPLTYKLIAEQFKRDSVYIIPGFYGMNGNGQVKVFPRNGSDITGAVVARGIKANLYENWTDVDGIKAADPRIVPNSRSISEITYKEMRELSYRGADVLQRDAVLSVAEVGIPTQLRNSLNPNHPGTMITTQRESSDAETVIAIAGKSGFVSYTIEKSGMNNIRGVSADILDFLRRLGISHDHLMTGIDSITVVFEGRQIKNEPEILQKIHDLIGADRIIRDQIDLVCVVGQNIRKYQAKVGAAVFQVLLNSGIDVKMSTVPGNALSMTVGIEPGKVSDAVRSLYNALIS